MNEFNGLGMNLGNLSRLSGAETRSISAENFSGEKGKGGMATEGTGAACARDLGRGWKISPSIHIAAGETAVLADIEGSGAVQSLWIYYQINYTLTQVPEDLAYFHAQFRRVNPLPYKQDYTILDGVRGRGALSSRTARHLLGGVLVPDPAHCSLSSLARPGRFGDCLKRRGLRRRMFLPAACG